MREIFIFYKKNFYISLPKEFKEKENIETQSTFSISYLLEKIN